MLEATVFQGKQMKRVGIFVLLGVVGLTGCALTITPENVLSVSDLELCGADSSSRGRELEELQLIDSEIDRRGTDCAAVFDAERRRQEEIRRQQEEARRIAAEARALHEERETDRVAAAFGNYNRPGWRNLYQMPPNTNGETPNACLANDATGQEFSGDVELVDGDQLNEATQSYDFRPYSQYVIVIGRRGSTMIIEMDVPTQDGELPVYYETGLDQSSQVWQVSRFNAARCMFSNMF
jgi:hypothetical protein